MSKFKLRSQNWFNNPDNPSTPPQYIFWGDGTTDEMFFLPILYVDYEEGDETISLGSNQEMLGDVNFDGFLNVIDIVTLVNIILS